MFWNNKPLEKTASEGTINTKGVWGVLGRKDWQIWDLGQKGLKTVECEGKVRVTSLGCIFIWALLNIFIWVLMLEYTLRTASMFLWPLCSVRSNYNSLLWTNAENTLKFMNYMNSEWCGELLGHVKILYVIVDLRDWNSVFLNLFHTASAPNKFKLKTRHSCIQWHTWLSSWLFP